MFFTCFKLNIRHMFRQKEFLFTLTSSIVLLLGLLGVDLFSFIGMDTTYRYPAWYYWGYEGGFLSTSSELYGSVSLVSHANQIFIMVFLPFAGALAYAYVHYDNMKTGAVKQLLSRVTRTAYYRSTACAVFLGGFLVTFLPLVLEQAVLCTAFPWQLPKNVAAWPVLDDYASFLNIPDAYRSIRMNHPYFYNLLLCLAPAITAGLFALCSYTLSLFIHRSRFLVLTLPGILFWLIPLFSLQKTQYYHSIFQFGAKTDFAQWGVAAAALLLLNIIATEIKIHKIKDAL